MENNIIEAKESVYKNEYEAFLKMIKNETMSKEFNKSFTEEEIQLLSDIKNDFLKLLDKINTINHNDEVIEVLTDLLCSKHTFPILGTEDEWLLNSYNKRNLHVFKDKQGRVSFDTAIMFYDKTNGTAFFGNYETVSSKQYFPKLPFYPKVFFVEVKQNKKGDYTVNNQKELKEALNYYKGK